MVGNRIKLRPVLSLPLLPVHPGSQASLVACTEPCAARPTLLLAPELARVRLPSL